jgi:hypothetical protein
MNTSDRFQLLRTLADTEARIVRLSEKTNMRGYLASNTVKKSETVQKMDDSAWREFCALSATREDILDILGIKPQFKGN